SAEYVDRLERCGAVLSMSRPGRPWENGRCESFIRTLKHEQLNGQAYQTLEELQTHIEEFIEQVYTPVRLHSALAYQSPMAFEARNGNVNFDDLLVTVRGKHGRPIRCSSQNQSIEHVDRKSGGLISFDTHQALRVSIVFRMSLTAFHLRPS